MELRHLRYFVAVAEDLNVSKAAARLFLAQPALSRQIRDLEEEVGARLFEREAKGVVLTAAGHALLQEARLILEHSERAIRLARSTASAHTGTLCIGYSPVGLYSTVALEALRTFRLERPAVRVSLRQVPVMQQWEQLRNGQIDLGMSPLDYAPGEFASEQLCSDRLEFIFPAGHHLAARPSLRLLDMVGEPFIVPSSSISSVVYDSLMRAWHERGFFPRVVYESDSFLTTLVMVSSGVGISACGRDFGRRLSLGVDMRRAVDFDFNYGASVIWVSERISPALDAFLQHVRHARAALAHADGGP